MRRLICAIIVVFVLVGGAAPAEERFDFSGMTLEELLEMREALDSRIQQLSREEAEYYESGVYLVGRDIPEGDYVLQEAPEALFSSAVVRAGEDESSPILIYNLINVQAAIHLRADTSLTLNEAVAVPLDDASALGLDGRVVHEGSYLVGKHIPAGRYTASIVEKAPLPSYSVYSGILGTDAQLIKFEVLHDDTPVELQAGNYIELSGCILTVEEDY